MRTDLVYIEAKNFYMCAKRFYLWNFLYSFIPFLFILMKKQKFLHVNMFRSSPSEVFWWTDTLKRCAANPQENTYAEVLFQWSCLTPSLKSHSHTSEFAGALRTLPIRSPLKDWSKMLYNRYNHKVNLIKTS